MNHRLIAVNASSPGAGKSTLAARLADELAAVWLSEQDLIGREAFARCGAALRRNDPAAIDLFLDAADALVAEHGGRDEVWIVDSMLPGFLFLHGRYRRERIERYRDRVARAFAPLSPFLVCLSGDPAVFLERAERRSGPGFTERVLAALRQTPLPAYEPGSIEDADAMTRFFRWADQQTRSLLDGWPAPTLVLEADVLSPDQLYSAVARGLRDAASD